MEKGHPMATEEPAVCDRHFPARVMATALRIFSKIHIIVYHWTGGIIGERILGNRMLLLTTTGRKTGQPRTTPVAYLTDGDAMIIIGGAAGATKHPAWWLNLQSHPEAQVQVGRRRLRVSAARVLLEEQQGLWVRYPTQHVLFESMQKRVPRDIPVVILRPMSESNRSPLAHKKLVGSTAADTPLVASPLSRTETYQCLQHIICLITRALLSKRRHKDPNGLMKSSIRSRVALWRSMAAAFIILMKEAAPSCSSSIPALAGLSSIEILSRTCAVVFAV